MRYDKPYNKIMGLKGSDLGEQLVRKFFCRLIAYTKFYPKSFYDYDSLKNEIVSAFYL